ncbi:replication protein A 70 kDa DNA-binding subunit B-like [Branchiostoma floridae]|uniref:Replication protein A 70 kDa DNA-binding subunit B-like n=1 Tax=Branchiostoma floridae TaxID=7739 RepID=A0A9J7L0S2_BRAFL|nr:replication protein A 70 kDa DNA-binding subunit B-like [Branchiostoma floridae]
MPKKKHDHLTCTPNPSSSEHNRQNSTNPHKHSEKDPPAPEQAVPPPLANTDNVSSTPDTNIAIADIDSNLNRTYTLHVKVISKSDITPFSRLHGKSSGNRLSLMLADTTANLKAVAWNKTAERVFHAMDVDKTYTIKNFIIKPANKKYTSTKFELTFTDNTIIEPTNVDLPCNVDTVYTTIDNLTTMTSDSYVSVVGIIHRIHPPTTVHRKYDGQPISKTIIDIADDTKTSVSVTFWNAEDKTALYEIDKTVLHLQNAKLTIYNDAPQLSVTSDTTVLIDENNHRSKELLETMKTIPHDDITPLLAITNDSDYRTCP